MALGSHQDVNTTMDFKQYYEHWASNLENAGLKQNAGIYMSESERCLFYHPTKGVTFSDTSSISSAGREPDSFAVLVKVAYLAALGKPFAFFIHRTHGEQAMGAGVAVPLVVDGKVGNHAFGNKKLTAAATDKVCVPFRRNFPWDGKRKPPGKLGVLLFFLRFGRVP